MDFFFANWPPIALLAVIIGVALWQLWSRPRTPITRPIMLPKGSPIIIGLLISAMVGAALTFGLYGILRLSFPTAVAQRPDKALIALATFGTISTFFAVWVFISGFSAKPVQVGYGAIPLILKARSWIKILLPEGISWSIPYLFEPREYDLRARALFETDDPNDDVIEVKALAKVIPPDITTPPGAKESDTIQNVKKVFEVPVKVKVVVRIQTFDPYRYAGYNNPEGLLLGSIEERVREFVRGTIEDGKDAFNLPDLKEEMTAALIDQLEETAAHMGIDFIKLFVTEIRLPKDISKEGENLLRELIQRSREMYQAQTLEQTVKILKPHFPNLGDKELKNMVLTAARLATTQAFSYEGGPGTVLPITTPPGVPRPPEDSAHHQGHEGGHHHG